MKCSRSLSRALAPRPTTYRRLRLNQLHSAARRRPQSLRKKHAVFQHQHSGLGVGLGLLSLSTLAFMSSFGKCEEDVKGTEDDHKEQAAAQPAEDKLDLSTVKQTLIVLDSASVKELREKLGTEYSQVEEEGVIVVSSTPTVTELEDLDDLIDSEVQFSVLGVLNDGNCQVALLGSDHLHIHPEQSSLLVLLSSKETEKVTTSHAQHLAAAVLNDGGFGVTRAFSGLVKVDGVEMNVEYVPCSKLELQVEGTFCTDVEWDAPTQTCKHKRENQCAFCIFMKAGPCRKEFIAWEKCVDLPNKDEEDDDFVDRCASQTLVLKSCVDNNPEYYYVVGDNEQDDEVVEKAKKVVSAEDEKQDAITDEGK